MEVLNTISRPALLAGAAAVLVILLFLASRQFRLAEWITSGTTSGRTVAKTSKVKVAEGKIAEPDPLPILDVSDATTRDHRKYPRLQPSRALEF